MREWRSFEASDANQGNYKWVALCKEDMQMAKDPVCGMNVDEKKAAGTVSHKGKAYYFCSANCKAQFEKNPETYVAK